MKKRFKTLTISQMSKVKGGDEIIYEKDRATHEKNDGTVIVNQEEE